MSFDPSKFSKLMGKGMVAYMPMLSFFLGLPALLHPVPLFQVHGLPLFLCQAHDTVDTHCLFCMLWALTVAFSQFLKRLSTTKKLDILLQLLSWASYFVLTVLIPMYSVAKSLSFSSLLQRS